MLCGFINNILESIKLLVPLSIILVTIWQVQTHSIVCTRVHYQMATVPVPGGPLKCLVFRDGTS